MSEYAADPVALSERDACAAIIDACGRWGVKRVAAISAIVRAPRRRRFCGNCAHDWRVDEEWTPDVSRRVYCDDCDHAFDCVACPSCGVTTAPSEREWWTCGNCKSH